MRRSRLSTALVPTAVAALVLATSACGTEAADRERTSAAPQLPKASPTATPSPAASVPAEPTPPPAAELVTGSAHHRVRAQITPENGETVGVGQPLAIVFKGQRVDPALRAGIEGRLKVSTSPQVTGAWHWAEAKGDTLVHFRPRTYWKAGTKVSLDARLERVKLTDGAAGAVDRRVSFTIGESMVSTVDLKAHTMTVARGGKPVRTIAISGGEERFKTRDGIKTILSKDGRVIMDSRTIGIPRNSPDGYYDAYNWSMRETISGEYIHAAPDNAEHFGKRNVSHGCIGMSETDAKWLYELSRKGDVVQVVGSAGKPMDTFGNGYGDWNLSWEQWLKGSATGERVG